MRDYCRAFLRPCPCCCHRPGRERGAVAPVEPDPPLDAVAPIPDLVGPYTAAVIRVVSTAAVGGVVLVLRALGLGGALALALTGAGIMTGRSSPRRRYTRGRYRDLIRH